MKKDKCELLAGFFTEADMSRRTVRALAIAAAVALSPTLVGSQEPTGKTGPRFFFDSNDKQSPVLIDASKTPILRQRLQLNLEDVSVKAAIDEISRKSGVAIWYSDDMLRRLPMVHLKAADITLAAALTDVLLDSHLDVVFSSDGKAMLVPSDDGGSALIQTGAIAGRITDQNTGAAVPGVNVSVDRTSLRALSDGDGRYRITGVPVGVQRLIARRLGYFSAVRSVIVGDRESVEDFALLPSASSLDEVVVTATGDQRRRVLGNLIETVAADSIVALHPVTSFSDIISGRVAGVHVFQPGGLTGAAPAMTIRGKTAVPRFDLPSPDQPLVIIDGARVNNSPAGMSDPTQLFGLYGGRLNDISPSEIESIEIVKGPSAATLYGTDAANGVILVTTKRGEAGRPRWTLTTEHGTLTFDRDAFAESYAGSGHTTDGTNTPVPCALADVALGTCVQDSITHFSPLRDPQTTPIGTGARDNYSVQVAGGADTRYFASATVTREIGYLKIPSADLPVIRAERGDIGIAYSELHPNALSQVSLRSNLTTRLGSKADILFSSGYSSIASRIPSTASLANGEFGPGYRDQNDGWYNGYRPGFDFLHRNTTNTSHFTGSSTANWYPTTHFRGHLTAGIDFASTYNDALVRADDDPNNATGYRANAKSNVTLYTGDIAGTLTGSLFPGLSSSSSVGVQYNRQQSTGSAVTGLDLTIGCQIVACAALVSGTEVTRQSVVAGSYLEEILGYRDHLFLTGALRADGSSSFGSNFKTAVYPKASVSWLISEEPFWPRIPGLTTFRIRGAYGESGIQPSPTDALRTVVIGRAFVDGAPAVGATLGNLGNPGLKPERRREHEAGADLELWHNRVRFSGTYYRKKSEDALYSLAVPASLGGGSQARNVGSVLNTGFESTLSALLLDARAGTWDLSVNLSTNHNKLLSLGPGFTPIKDPFGLGSYVPGYPLDSYFMQPITGYSDDNGNGIIEPGEVRYGDSAIYVGHATPTNQLTLETSVSLFDHRLRFGAQLDHRGGFRLTNDVVANQCSFFNNNCRAVVDPAAPLSAQAAAVAVNDPASNFSEWGYLENGSFTRLRELSITYSLPQTLLRFVRASDANLTLAARNVALWTKYSGDPEATWVGSDAFTGSASNEVNFGAAPTPRYFIVRLNIGF